MPKEEKYEIEEYHNRRVAYFGAWVNAWINNRMEKDKQLLTLSALAIGLLVGVLRDLETVGELFLWLGATISFIATLFFILHIFGKNTKYIEILLDMHQADETEGVVLGKKEQEMTKSLNKKTVYAFRFFILGAILTAVLVVVKSGFIIVKEIN